MKQYHDLLKHVLENGKQREDRTGTGTLSVFGYQTRYNLADGFPLVTTKKVFWNGIVDELLWFLKANGRMSLLDLPERSRQIWSPWAQSDGDLGRIYGAQWRTWIKEDASSIEFIDQIAKAIVSIKANPNDRGIIVNTWNVAELEDMALRPCHAMFQFYVQDGKLSCQLYQRSGDAFLGVPFNIASYALLTTMIAQVTGLELGEFVHSFGDLHIYNNHLEQVRLQLSREPKPLAELILNPTIKSIDAFSESDIVLLGYKSHPAIKGRVSV